MRRKKMNGNQTLTVTRGDRVALESRVSQFHNQYLTAISDEEKKWALDEKGKVKLGAVLDEMGYLKDGDAPVYRHLSVDFQQREPVIEMLEFRDVLNNKDGFSYIRLSNLEELDAYTQVRNARLAGNYYDEGTLLLGFSGMVLGAVIDFAGLIIASNTGWDPNGAWLLAPPFGGILLGATIGGILEHSGSTKVKEATSFFQKQYSHRVTTGSEAILKALNFPYSQALPEGQ